jgi:hypothetical protein
MKGPIGTRRPQTRRGTPRTGCTMPSPRARRAPVRARWRATSTSARKSA